jgi:DNA-binding IclR family transcriptional regulator
MEQVSSNKTKLRVAAERQPLVGDLKLEEHRDFVTAIARGFAILRCFTRNAKILGNKEISARTGLAKSTVARLTYTLTKLGYLEYLPAQEKYSLGVGMLRLGQNYLAGLDVREVARPLMQDLADEAQATVAFAAHHGNDMVFLEICHGHPTFQLRVEVGARVPHGMTALGRAHLAALSEQKRAEFTSAYSKLVKKDDWAKISQAFEQARNDYQKYGFCVSLGDWNKEVGAVGVPMVSDDGARILAFSCIGPARDMTRQRITNDIGPKLIGLRDRVKAKLGGEF